jgi:glycine cleavage system aminomethyltransferase T
VPNEPIVFCPPKWIGNLGRKSRVRCRRQLYLPAVSVFAPSDGAWSSLESALLDAGAVFSNRDGRPTVVHYGSPAGELAVCVRAVGLLDRSELTKLVIEAPPAQLSHLVARLAGGTVSAGGALIADGAWWCGAGNGRVIVVCEPHVGKRLLEHLLAPTLHQVAVTVRDRSRDWAAIGLLGRNAGKVLRAVGVYGESGDPRQVAPFSSGTVGGIDAFWLLESDCRALLLVPEAFAGRAWRAVEQAGRPFGISCVGIEAARRYALLERGRQPATPVG